MRRASSETARCDTCETSVSRERKPDEGDERGGRATRRLQQSVGNQAMQELHERGELQASLAVGGSDTRYEREAERIARRMRFAEPETADGTPGRGVRADDTWAGDGNANAAITRESTGVRTDRHEEQPRDLRQSISVRRTPGNDGVSAGTNGVSDGTDGVPEDAERAVRRAFGGGGNPLSERTRSFFEPRFGTDLSDVRVHTGAAADEAAKSIDAEAFTLGTDVAFASGKYDPASAAGTQLLAHELTHVVQQTGTTALRGSIQRQETPDSGSSGDSSDSSDSSGGGDGSEPSWPPDGWQVQTYEVTGECGDLQAQMNRKGPGRDGENVAGKTDWDSAWKAEPGNGDWRKVSSGCSGGTCECTVKLVDVHVELPKKRIVVPEWTDYDDASDSERESWDAFVEQLRRHERGHVEIVERYRKEAETALEDEFVGEERSATGSRSQACADAQEKLIDEIDDRWRELENGHDEKHDAYHETAGDEQPLDCPE